MSYYQLRQELIPLLLGLTAPASLDELAADTAARLELPPEQLRALLEQVRRAGLLQECAQLTDQAATLFLDFAAFDSQRMMLRDAARTDSFVRAIGAVAKPGQTVIDVGTGTGILAFAAARAGARVHAIDQSKVIDTARALAAANGLAERIEFFRGPATAFSQPVKADLIVSEWIGHFLLVENMFPAVAAVRDRTLKPGGRMLPSAANMTLAPLEDRALYVKESVGFWESPLQGFDYRPVKALELPVLRTTVAVIRPDSLITDARVVHRLDCQTAGADDLYFEKTVDFVSPREATVHGFAGWFDLELAPGITLDTSPFAVTTHWQQMYLPIDAVRVDAGDVLRTTLTCAPGAHRPALTVALEVLRGGRQVHRQQRAYNTGLL